MRRSCTRAALVVSIMLVIACVSSHGFARELSRKHSSEKEGEKKPVKESAVGFVTVGIHRPRPCRSKKIDLCGYLSRARNNESLVDDDKRVVPTGPNPLHNRWRRYRTEFREIQEVKKKMKKRKEKKKKECRFLMLAFLLFLWIQELFSPARFGVLVGDS